MRTGVCSIQQALTAEAAATVKQAVGLARRRGHAQVTPLHVASAMLGTSTTGLLKRACLQCHSHPLQCKALELCFNVSLNRLPASTSSPLLGPPHHSSHHHPSLSNALVAAFKRAQAHQRRGSIENQQQPILALKIEIEQLIVSILDDPSVSRVMREAGFSSTLVKNKVEQAVSLEACSPSMATPILPKESTKPLLLGANVVSHSSTPFGQFGMMSALHKPLENVIRNDDVMSVLGSLASKKRNTVIVGESVGSIEGVVRGVMDKFERGEVPGELRYVQPISLPLLSLRNLSKEEVEQKLVELRCLVKSYVSRGVVLYMGDLKWVSEFWSSYGKQRRSYYCPVEHIVMELRRMACGGEAAGRLWLLGVATFQTYIKCKTGHPSLEAILELHPLAVPVGSLSLSLNLSSGSQSHFRSKVSKEGSNWALPQAELPEKHLTCCTDCSVNFDREAQSLTSGESKKVTSTSSNLPAWLRQYKEESTRNTTNDEECVSVMDLCKKWNSICSSSHKHQSLHLASLSPTSSPSVSSHEHDPNLHNTHLNWPVLVEPKRSPKEHQFWISEQCGDQVYESKLNMLLPEVNESKPELLSNPNSSPNSASSSEVMEDTDDGKFKEFNAENLMILCSALEAKAPQQKDAICDIASTILQCRSGMRKAMNTQREDKEETWLMLLGVDESQTKEKIAREIAKVVFGFSQTNFISISPNSFSSSSTSREESKNKRKRDDDEDDKNYLERFGEAVNENPRRVFLMEDWGQIDSQYCLKNIKKAIDSGSITLPGGETVPLKDGIVIFSCESLSNSGSKTCSPARKVQKCGEEDQEKQDHKDENELEGPCGSLDLNIAVDEEHSVGEIGILELVDKVVTFKTQQL